jgi:hypothetical protein
MQDDVQEVIMINKMQEEWEVVHTAKKTKTKETFSSGGGGEEKFKSGSTSLKCAQAC